MVPVTHNVGRLRGSAAELLAQKSEVLHTIAPEATVYQAVERMNEHRVGALLVMTGDRLQGIVSERDYARKVILQGRASKDTPVADIMTPAARLHTITPETSLNDCLSLVNDTSVRHLPVLRGDRVVGLLSIRDLVRAVVEQQAEMIRNLSSYIGSDYPV